MSTFAAKVLAEVRLIPFGKVASYGQIALWVGRPRAAREVGWALNQNDDQNIPWWRVVNKTGRITFKGSQLFGPQDQVRALQSEGIQVNNFQIDMKRYGYTKT